MNETLDWKLIDRETGRIDLEVWKVRVLASTSVGRCPVDDGYLMPEPAEKAGPRVTWLSSQCANATCRHRVVAIAERPVKEPLAA